MNKVIGRYIVSAAVVALVLLILNISIFVLWISRASEYGIKNYDISKITEELEFKEGHFYMSEKGSSMIDDEYQWAMLLDNNGEVIWEKSLPSEIPKKFSVPEVAGFSKWYLKDYPVKAWRVEDKLFVIGSPKGSIWKLGIEMPEHIMKNMPQWMLSSLILNCMVAIVLSLMMGIRFYKSLGRLTDGIEALGQNRYVSLESKGVFSNLSDSINRASAKLKYQEGLLNRRDDARTTWIAGVSHDIRTPLSLVMGYASQLEDSEALREEDKDKAKIIRIQSQKIKKLVSDLNLASKLEYNIYPVSLEKIYISKLLRSIVVEVLNSNMGNGYEIKLNLKAEAGTESIVGDEDLIRRALVNVLENCIVHNPNGCEILVSIETYDTYTELLIEDNGEGFPEEIILKNKIDEKLEELGNHGLGLIIVKQILKLHGGKLVLKNKLVGSSAGMRFYK